MEAMKYTQEYTKRPKCVVACEMAQTQAYHFSEDYISESGACPSDFGKLKQFYVRLNWMSWISINPGSIHSVSCSL